MIINLSFFDESPVMSFSVPDDSFTVGRSMRNDVVLLKESISRQHCRIDIIDGDIYVTDLHSTNGVFIDGERIPPGKKTLVPTFLNLSLGPVKHLQVVFDLTQSKIIQDPNTRFFRPAPETLTKTKKNPSHISLERPKYNPVRPPIRPKSSSKRVRVIASIMAALLLACVGWYVKKNFGFSKNVDREQRLKQSLDEEFF